MALDSNNKLRNSGQGWLVGASPFDPNNLEHLEIAFAAMLNEPALPGGERSRSFGNFANLIEGNHSGRIGLRAFDFFVKLRPPQQARLLSLGGAFPHFFNFNEDLSAKVVAVINRLEPKLQATILAEEGTQKVLLLCERGYAKEALALIRQRPHQEQISLFSGLLKERKLGALLGNPPSYTYIPNESNRREYLRTQVVGVESYENRYLVALAAAFVDTVKSFPSALKEAIILEGASDLARAGQDQIVLEMITNLPLERQRELLKDRSVGVLIEAGHGSKVLEMIGKQPLEEQYRLLHSSIRPFLKAGLRKGVMDMLLNLPFERQMNIMSYAHDLLSAKNVLLPYIQGLTPEQRTQMTNDRPEIIAELITRDTFAEFSTIVSDLPPERKIAILSMPRARAAFAEDGSLTIGLFRILDGLPEKEKCQLMTRTNCTMIGAPSGLPVGPTPPNRR